MNGDFTDDPRAPVFFVSYARVRPARRPVVGPHEVNQHVRRLYADLTSVVNELIPVLPGEDPGFMDTTMDGGENWQAQLLQAAGTCQVFIGLLSTPYLHSEWCALEWDAFSRRTVVRRAERTADHVTGILPVLWAPIERPIPPVVAAINWFTPTDLPDPDFGAQYRRYGILGLSRMRLDQAYEAIIWALALQVQRMHHSHWVEPAVPPDTEGLHRTFLRKAG